MAKKYDPRKAAEKQIRKVSEATQDYIDGIEGIEVHPGQQAIRKKDKMKRKWLASIDGGKWEDAVGTYSLDDYKATARTLGADRLVTGVRKAEQKTIEFHEQLSDHLSRTQDAIDNMDDSTEAGAKAKMNANFDRMRSFKRVRRRR